jgi:hypothetical protein
MISGEREMRVLVYWWDGQAARMASGVGGVGSSFVVGSDWSDAGSHGRSCCGMYGWREGRWLM